MQTPLLLQNLNMAPGRPPGVALPEGMKASDSEGVAEEFAAILQELGDRLGRGLPVLQGVDPIVLTDGKGVPLVASADAPLTPEQEATQILAALIQMLGGSEAGGEVVAGGEGEPVELLAGLRSLVKGGDETPPELAPLTELLAKLPEDLKADVERVLQAGKLLPASSSADGSPAQGQRVPPTKGELQQLLSSLKAAVAGLATQIQASGPTAAETPEGRLAALVETKLETAGETDAEPPELLALRTLVARMTAGDPGAPEVLAGRRAELPDGASLREIAGASASPLGAAPAPAQAAAAGAAMRSLLAEGPSFAQAIPVPPGHPQWGQALGERVLWMVGREVQSAEVRLNPPQLGPMEIRVAVQNDQASVTFHAQHPLTREALEQAIPRLREMLAENNLSLVSVDVGQRESGQARGGSGSGGHQSGEGFGWDGGSAEGTGEDARATARVTSGLVDDFA